jgi:hypothetical protein
MKLIIVDRAKADAYARLKKQFEDDLGVEVVFDRRSRERRLNPRNRGPERRSRDRRRLTKTYNGKDYIVIHIAK